MGALDGRVAIITGAGRGIGREHALLFAARGGQGRRERPRRRGRRHRRRPHAGPAGRARRSRRMGGEAIANADNVADWEGGQRLINAAVEAFGDLDILVNNAGILRDRVLVNMTEEEWDAVIAVHLKGHFVPTRWAAAYWREQTKAGIEQAPQPGAHLVDVGSVLQPRPDQLRRGQVGHRHVQPDLRQGAGPLRREEQLHRPRRPHPPHGGHPGSRRDREGARRRRAASTSGTRRTSRRSSPTWRRRPARSPARRSSCRAAR